MFGLTDKIAALAGGGLSIALAGALVFVWVGNKATLASKNAEISALKSERESYRQSWEDCKANQRILEVTIESQNDAINQVRSASAARVEALEKVADNAESNAARARREAQRIMNSKASTENLCDAANALILEEVQ